MAKVKPSRKPEKKAAKVAKREAKPRERKPSPRSVALPGMEQPRHVELDNACESIGDYRDAVNAAVLGEKQDKAAALQYMSKKGIHGYKHAGIELLRVPGADTLRVHKTKQDGDAQTGGEANDAGGVQSEGIPF